MSKQIKILVVILMVLVFSVVSIILFRYKSIIYITPNNHIVGADRDPHGCIGSAGYSWCASKNKCLRIWEEKCE